MTIPTLPPVIVPLTFILYEASGEISVRFTGTTDDAIATSAAMGKSYLQVDERVDPDTQYVLNGVLTDKPSNDATISGMVLSNVPVPATVWIDGSAYATTEPTVELDLPLPGTYDIMVRAFPRRDKTFTVTVP